MLRWHVTRLGSFCCVWPGVFSFLPTLTRFATSFSWAFPYHHGSFFIFPVRERHMQIILGTSHWRELITHIHISINYRWKWEGLLYSPSLSRYSTFEWALRLHRNRKCGMKSKHKTKECWLHCVTIWFGANNLFNCAPDYDACRTGFYTLASFRLHCACDTIISIINLL